MSSGSRDTRIRILKAARALLEDQGAAATRLVDVAKAAGVSRQAVYLHFGSRAGLLVALVEYVDEANGLYERIVAIHEAPTGIDALRVTQTIAAEYAPVIHPVAMALLQVQATDPAAAAAAESRLQARLGGMRRTVARIEAEGHLADGWTVDAAAEAVWVLGLPWSWQHLGVEQGWSVEDYTALLIRNAMSLIVAK